MKYSFSTLFLTLSLLGFSNLSVAQQKDCSVGIFKTYHPRAMGHEACDDHGLPAEFAGNLSTLISGLNHLGYKAQKYDQCANGTCDSGDTYSLVSQLGDCAQTGSSLSCKLNVTLYDNKTNKALFENTIESEGLGGVRLHLSEALDGLPACSSL